MFQSYELVIKYSNRSICHFIQAGEIPLDSNEVIDMLSFGGDTKISQHILDGIADNSQITDGKAAQILLESMKGDIYYIVLEFTPQDMMNQ